MPPCTCTRGCCGARAAWVPVLLLRAHPEHVPAEGHLPGVLVCDAHRSADPRALVPADGWRRIVAAFRVVGLADPVFQLTELDYRPIQ